MDSWSWSASASAQSSGLLFGLCWAGGTRARAAASSELVPSECSATIKVSSSSGYQDESVLMAIEFVK